MEQRVAHGSRTNGKLKAGMRDKGETVTMTTYRLGRTVFSRPEHLWITTWYYRTVVFIVDWPSPVLVSEKKRKKGKKRARRPREVTDNERWEPVRLYPGRNVKGFPECAEREGVAPQFTKDGKR